MKELKLIPPTDPRVQCAIAPFNNDMSNVASVVTNSASTSWLFNVILDCDLHSEITWLFVTKYPFLSIKKPEPLATFS